MKIVVYTGAGISRDSGIPLFDEKNSIFTKYSKKILLKDGWKKHWSVFKKFMDELELSLTSADIKPNKFHYLISKWQKETNDEFTIITTNIDDLHEQAGNKNVIHIHGNIKEKRTLGNGKIIPNCVLFGERKNFIHECYKIIKKSDLLICVGSSLSTGDENLLKEAIKNKVKTIEINPSKTLYSDYFDHSFRKKGYEGLSKIYNYLTKKNNPEEIFSLSI